MTLLRLNVYGYLFPSVDDRRREFSEAWLSHVLALFLFEETAAYLMPDGLTAELADTSGIDTGHSALKVAVGEGHATPVHSSIPVLRSSVFGIQHLVPLELGHVWRGNSQSKHLIVAALIDGCTCC